MKRDMDLIRSLLLRVESNESEDAHFDGFEKGQVKYHMALLVDAGLAKGHISYVDADPEIPARAKLWSLTWDGHEFLDAAREPSRWQEASSIVNNLGGASFQVWLSVLTDLVKQNIGITSL